MTAKQRATFSPRTLDRLRMLADWQVRQEGHDPAEITRLCQEADDRQENLKLLALKGRLNESN